MFNIGNDTGNMDITSANATATLFVEGIYDSGFTLEQFTTDQAINGDTVEVTETRMGVDGKMVAGQTPNIKPVGIYLEASSPSYGYMVQVAEAMIVNRKIYRSRLVVDIPSIGIKITWSNGVMKNGSIAPGIRRVLEPTQWLFHFQDMEITEA